MTLTADGKHLMTDIWTSIGVLAGVVLVGVTGWQRLDPVVAAIVGVNILVTGGRLATQSVRALLDQAIGPPELATVVAALDGFRSTEVSFHGQQSRQSGRHRFVSMHVLVPGAWTVQAGHDLLEQVETAIRHALPDTTLLTHLEPSEDPRAYEDYAFRRTPRSPHPTQRTAWQRVTAARDGPVAGTAENSCYLPAADTTRRNLRGTRGCSQASEAASGITETLTGAAGDVTDTATSLGETVTGAADQVAETATSNLDRLQG